MRWRTRFSVPIDSGCPSTTCFVYNAEGRRVRKIAGGVTTDYIYGMGGVVAEKVGSTWTVVYVYANGQLVAQYKDSTTYFVHKDHLGSSRVLTKVDKSTLETYDYLPYGEAVGSSGSGTKRKFTGHERDESGLDYMGARFYTSLAGRFLSPDRPFIDQHSTNPQSWNLYLYARNNPIFFLDSNGRAAITFLLAHFIYHEYQALGSRSFSEGLEALTLKKRQRGAGYSSGQIKNKTLTPPGVKDPGFNPSALVSALGKGVTEYVFKRSIQLAYFADITTTTREETFTDSSGAAQKRTITEIRANLFYTTDPFPPTTITGYRQAQFALNDPSSIVAINPGADLQKLSDSELAAVRKEANKNGYDELDYVLQIEESRRRKAQEEEKRKKAGKKNS